MALIGEIRIFGGNFAPAGWKKCSGEILDVNGNEALYSVLGTEYGGDGQTTFALPDMTHFMEEHWPDFELAMYIICVDGDYPTPG